MATFTVQSMVDAGTKPNMTLNTVTASDRFDVGSGTNTFVRYTNTSGSPVTVTVKGSGTTSYAVSKPDNVLTLAATTGELWIPLRKEYDQGDGLGAQITTSAQTNVQAALIRYS